MNKHDLCLHVCISRLRLFLQNNKLTIWGELTENGWVNVHCDRCKCTHEVRLDGEDEGPEDRTQPKEGP
jgi:hypothetical protein